MVVEQEVNTTKREEAWQVMIEEEDNFLPSQKFRKLSISEEEEKNNKS